MAKRRQDDPDISLTTMVVVVGTVLTFAAVVFLSAVFYQAENSELQRKVVNEAPQKIRSLRVDQNAILDGYRWIDKDAGIVAIPIDRAMKMMVEHEREAAQGGGE